MRSSDSLASAYSDPYFYICLLMGLFCLAVGYLIFKHFSKKKYYDRDQKYWQDRKTTEKWLDEWDNVKRTELNTKKEF